MEVKMADVGADMAGGREPDLGVHVGSIHVDLAAVGVDQIADILDRAFEHPVRGRIGHHQRREIVAVRVGLGLEIGDIDVAVGIARHRHDLEAAHRGGRGIGSVRGGRNKTHVAVSVRRGTHGRRG